jgi:glycerol kinase
MQFQADVLGIPIERSQMLEVTHRLWSGLCGMPRAGLANGAVLINSFNQKGFSLT